MQKMKIKSDTIKLIAFASREVLGKTIKINRAKENKTKTTQWCTLKPIATKSFTFKGNWFKFEKSNICFICIKTVIIRNERVTCFFIFNFRTKLN